MRTKDLTLRLGAVSSAAAFHIVADPVLGARSDVTRGLWEPGCTLGGFGCERALGIVRDWSVPAFSVLIVVLFIARDRGVE